MKKIVFTIAPLAIIIIATALLIHTTYIENLNKDTRLIIGLAYTVTLVVSLIMNYINVKKVHNK